MKSNILIVEDEPAIAEALQYALERDGFATQCLYCGLPALPLLASESIDLILLDVGLPDISGFELCKRIRLSHTTPVIFMTARSDEIDRVVGLEIGADDYVVKPFSPREVTARIRAVLRRTQGGGRPAEYSGRTPVQGFEQSGTLTTPAGGSQNSETSSAFTVNEAKRQVAYFGKPLELSNYEYRILLTFVRQPGHVYSREQLMDMVWTEPLASMDRTVDAHIKNLRAKLREIRADIDPIITHRGTGYALREGL